MAIRHKLIEINADENYLSYIKDKYGDEVSIVKVGQVKGRTPTNPGVLEVLIAIDDKYVLPNKINKQAALVYNEEQQILEENSLKKINLNHHNNQATINSVRLEKQDKQILNDLKDKVEYLMHMRWDELAPFRRNLDIPPEFAEIYHKAKMSGMLQTHLDEIMLATFKNMPKSLLSNKTAIHRYFSTLLKNMIPCRVDAPIRKQKIIMLVGPTGVGKTTTLAKLAYRYAYGNRRYQTAIISLDNFRLGAKEQLAEYARSMRLPITFTKDENDLQQSLKSLHGYDVILIDSTGNSQNDKSKIEKLESYLNVSQSEIEVNLVLNAGMKYDDMLDTFNAFNVLKIETLIFTKFDETKTFGNIFSLVFNVKKPVSFFSIGQNVPDDILVANSDYLVECLLNGFKG